MLFLLMCISFIESVQTHSSKFKGPPKNVTLTWNNPVMVIQTAKVEWKIREDCFKIFLQLKTRKKAEWQRNITSSLCSKMASSTQMQCNFAHPNLDPEKCFYSRLLIQTDKVCDYELNSEWSNEIFIKNYRLIESCDLPTEFGVSDFIILFTAISTLIIFIIVFIRCNIERMKNYVFPVVPDPKNSFHNLFDNHNGYFEEWVKTTMTDTHQEVVECITDEQNDQPVLTYVKENEVVIPGNQSVLEDNVKPTTQENAFNICFGNMNFTMNESVYVKL